MVFVQRWRVITAFALVGAATQLVWLTYAPVTTVAAEHFGVSESAVGWLANMFPLLYVVLAVPAGIALDRWFRPSLIAGAVLTAIGAVAAPARRRFRDRAHRSDRRRDRPTAGAQRHHRNRRALSRGEGPADASRSAPRAPSPVWRRRSSSARRCPRKASSSPSPPSARSSPPLAAIALTVELLRAGTGPAASTSTSLSTLRATIGDRYVRRLCVAVFFPFGTFVALATYGQALLEPSGVSADAASIVLLVNVLAGVVGCAVIPVAVLRRGVELPAVMVGLTASAAACLLVAVAPGLATGFLAFVLIGLTLLPALPIVLSMAERHTGAAEGTAAGLIWMTGNLGGLVVAGLTGLLVDQPALAFTLCATATILGVPLTLRLRRDETVAAT